MRVMHVLGAPRAQGCRDPFFLLKTIRSGFVWQTQQPLITSRASPELNRWPRLLERVQSYGVQSFCWLPLTGTARLRLGTLVLTSKQPSTYDTADVDFLQHVAGQSCCGRGEYPGLPRDPELSRTSSPRKMPTWRRRSAARAQLRRSRPGDAALLPLRARVLKQVETVAPTGSTVLVLGETGTGKGTCIARGPARNWSSRPEAVHLRQAR